MPQFHQLTSPRAIRLTIAYDGSQYHGWQIQPRTRTIQGEIERHLATLHGGSHIALHGAGRTDAGVHALAMVAHFHTQKSLTPSDFSRALNGMLDDDIRILAAEEAAPDFHARFSTLGKTYSYSLFNGPLLLPQHRYFSHHIKKKLNIPLMRQGLATVRGTHDFASFEAAGSRDPEQDHGRGAVRTIFQADLIDRGKNFYSFEITGDGFLRHMVRNIVGTLIEVGLERRSFDEFLVGFAAKERSQTGVTAPAHALTLRRIYYNRQELEKALSSS